MIGLSALPLTALRAVEAVGRRGVLSGAAGELNISTSAVSQHVLAAERRLGVVLFERTPAGLRPTPGGAVFLERLTRGFREIERAVADLQDQRSDILTVSVGPAFAGAWLVPRLGRFSQRHPHVQLRLSATVNLVDLDRTDVDVAIRLGDGQWPDLVVERLFGQTLFPIASPRVASGLGSIADLVRTPVVMQNDADVWAAWLAANGADPALPLRGPAYSDPLLALGAAVADQGVMMGWSLLAADALRDGRLARPFPGAIDGRSAYWMATRPETVRRPQFRIFRDWLREEFHETGEALAGLIGEDPVIA